MPLVKNLPNQTTEPVGDGANGLGVPEAGNEPAIHDGEDGALGLHGGVGGLIEDPAHLSIALGAAMTVVRAGTLLAPGTGAHPRREMLR